MKLVDENDPILLETQPELDLDNLDFDVHDVSTKMFDLMEEYNGVGLAAPQVGLRHRMFVCNVEGKKYTLLNPVIVSEHESWVTSKEGCLSFPNLFINIIRPGIVMIEYFNIDLKESKAQVSNPHCKIFMHEIDHLNGIVFTQRASKLTLKSAIERRKLAIKQHQRRIKNVRPS